MRERPGDVEIDLASQIDAVSSQKDVTYLIYVPQSQYFFCFFLLNLSLFMNVNHIATLTPFTISQVPRN